MGDKDYEGVLAAFEPHMAHLICTQNSTPRAMPAAELARAAVAVFGEDRVTVEPNLADAVDRAAALAEAGAAFGESIGAGGVLVTGSVVTVGEARALLAGPEKRSSTERSLARTTERIALREAAAATRAEQVRAEHAELNGVDE